MSELRSIERSLEHLPDEPLMSSRGRDWGSSITVDLHAANKHYEMDAPPLDHHFIACITEGSGRFRQDRGGRQHVSVLRGDSTLVMPAGQKARWWGEQPQNLRFRIPVSQLDQAWENIGAYPSRANEVQTEYNTRDPPLHSLGQMFLAEMRQPQHPAQRLMLESASCMVAAHVVRRYCTFGIASSNTPLRVPRHILDRIATYVEDNVSKPIRLDDLASIANISRFHFCRAFRDSMGMSPMHFVEQVRIRRAQEMIRVGKKSMRQIAHLVGYADQSHFSRRFALQSKCTPSEFASSQRVALDRDEAGA